MSSSVVSKEPVDFYKEMHGESLKTYKVEEFDALFFKIETTPNLTPLKYGRMLQIINEYFMILNKNFCKDKKEPSSYDEKCKKSYSTLLEISKLYKELEELNTEKDIVTTMPRSKKFKIALKRQQRKLTFTMGFISVYFVILAGATLYTNMMISEAKNSLFEAFNLFDDKEMTPLMLFNVLNNPFVLPILHQENSFYGHLETFKYTTSLKNLTTNEMRKIIIQNFDRHADFLSAADRELYKQDALKIFDSSVTNDAQMYDFFTWRKRHVIAENQNWELFQKQILNTTGEYYRQQQNAYLQKFNDEKKQELSRLESRQSTIKDKTLKEIEKSKIEVKEKALEKLEQITNSLQKLADEQEANSQARINFVEKELTENLTKKFSKKYELTKAEYEKLIRALNENSSDNQKIIEAYEKALNELETKPLHTASSIEIAKQIFSNIIEPIKSLFSEIPKSSDFSKLQEYFVQARNKASMKLSTEVEKFDNFIKQEQAFDASSNVTLSEDLLSTFVATERQIKSKRAELYKEKEDIWIKREKEEFELKAEERDLNKELELLSKQIIEVSKRAGFPEAAFVYFTGKREEIIQHIGNMLESIRGIQSRKLALANYEPSFQTLLETTEYNTYLIQFWLFWVVIVVLLVIVFTLYACILKPPRIPVKSMGYSHRLRKEFSVRKEGKALLEGAPSSTSQFAFHRRKQGRMTRRSVRLKSKQQRLRRSSSRKSKQHHLRRSSSRKSKQQRLRKSKKIRRGSK